MHAVVVYESMYGNTHLIADAIGRGLGDKCEVDVVPVDKADRRLLQDADLLVVGGPTHAHGMSRPSSREAAVVGAHKPGSDLSLDPDAEGTGLREWFISLPKLHARAAAFDTRVNIAPMLSGRASKGIGRSLRQHGMRLAVEPESFLVTKTSHLEPHEQSRAEAWGRRLGARLAAESVV
jgi:flavodoxin-like protein